ncbi:MAG: MarR family winged helix-turn-helix transcriptional regulator [Acetobacteraceae bacterium]
MKTKSGRTRQEAPTANGAAFKLEDFLPYRLSVAANRVARLCARRYSEAYGLGIPEWRVLAVVGRFGTLSPSAVGEWTAMDKVKVSRAAASLVTRGLLRQTQDPQDGRGRLLRLTRRGMTVHQGMVPLACELEDQLAEALSRTEWSVLLKALDKLNAHVKGVEGNGHDTSAA